METTVSPISTADNNNITPSQKSKESLIFIVGYERGSSFALRASLEDMELREKGLKMFLDFCMITVLSFLCRFGSVKNFVCSFTDLGMFYNTVPWIFRFLSFNFKP